MTSAETAAITAVSFDKLYPKGEKTMTINRRFLAAVIALSSAMTVTFSCSSKKSSSEAPAPTDEWKGEDDIALDNNVMNDMGLTKTSKGANPDMSITWLADYDLNPSGNNDRSVALALFEDYYGGQINYVYTSVEDKFTTLAAMINAGDQVDMFPYEWSAVPSGVLRDQYQPLDPYFESMEMDSDLWADMSDVIDMFSYNGQHYVVPYSISDPLIITYSRKMMQEEGLDDPYELYKSGKWDWDSFMSMMEKFKTNAPEGQNRYGINGWFGQAIIQSTGRTVVNYDNGRFTNNINDPEIEKAENLMQEIAQKQLYRGDWVGHFPEDHSTLFFAMGDWALGSSNAYNEGMDLMTVPFPKDPSADKYYLSCNYGARMLVKNSDHGQAVANYIKCERLAATEPVFRDAAKEKALIEDRAASGVLRSVVTEEQYDAVQSYMDPTVTSPMFDFGYGMGDAMNSAGNFTVDTRGVMDNITKTLLEGSTEVDSWAKLRDSLTGIIDKEIAQYNS